MAKQSKSSRQSKTQGSSAQKARQLSTSAATPREPQSRTRRVFTVVICVVVALGLMLPVAGLGFGSCFVKTDNSQGDTTDS